MTAHPPIQISHFSATVARMSAPGPSSPRPTVTHVDVARRAGVSTAVVSYVVNNGPRQVAPATAARVHAAIEELGYRPNLNARALRLGTTDLIGLVVPDSSNPFFAELAQGIERAAAQHGYSMVLVNSNNSGEQERLKVESLANRRVSGLLVASAVHATNSTSGTVMAYPPPSSTPTDRYLASIPSAPTFARVPRPPSNTC